MTVTRLTTVASVVRNWDFFRKGLNHVQQFLKYNVTLDTYRQIICFLVKQPSAYVAIVLDDSDEPVGFGIAHDCTPLFSPNIEYEVSILYHHPGQAVATAVLQAHFEQFCRIQGAKTYFVTTRRDSGSVIRCFQAPRYGLQRAYTVFRKDLN
jgi:hypothetical protein